MSARRLGGRTVQYVGVGCPPSEDDATALLHRALDLGYDHLDTEDRP